MAQPPALFVMSFDGDQDLWTPFFTLFFKYWPDCPYPIYLQTNELAYPDPRVISQKLGKDQGFSDLLARALEAIPHEHILLMMDDFFMTEPVDTAGVAALYELMRRRDASYLRLRPTPPPDQALGQEAGYGYGVISPGQLFRTALQIAFWRKRTLQGLISRAEPPREFEMRTGERSWQLPDEFLSLTQEPDRQPVPYFCTGVIHGHWVPAAVKLCQQHGIPVDLSKRKLQPWTHRLAHGNPLVGALRKLQWRWSERRRGVKPPG